MLRVPKGPARRYIPALSVMLVTALTFTPAVSAQTQSPRAQRLQIPELIAIPAGAFIQGSTRAERDAAYALDARAYGSNITRRQRWYETERPRRKTTLPAFRITKTPITNTQYHAFIKATGHRTPNVTRKTWKGYGLIHGFAKTRRHAWVNAKPPAGRGAHPVVLLAHSDARAYAAWLSAITNARWRLPREAEWEKAARGVDGRMFPWGPKFNPARLNSADAGPDDTVPVESYPGGASPFGLIDAAGQVYEWTATPDGETRFIVKGGGWDDKGCGVCRPAARHARPAHLKHILIGFRLVVE